MRLLFRREFCVLTAEEVDITFLLRVRAGVTLGPRRFGLGVFLGVPRKTLAADTAGFDLRNAPAGTDAARMEAGILGRLLCPAVVTAFFSELAKLFVEEVLRLEEAPGLLGGLLGPRLSRRIVYYFLFT